MIDTSLLGLAAPAAAMAPPRKRSWRASLFDRLNPSANMMGLNLTDKDKDKLGRQSLLSAALAMMGTRGQGMHGTLAAGLQGGLLASQQAPENILDARRKKQLMDFQLAQGGMPAGFLEFDRTARAAGLKPGTPAYERAAQIRLGLEGRAASGGFGFEVIKGADGRERISRRNPRNGAVEVYDESTGDFVPLGSSMGGQPQAPFIDPTLPPEIQADIRANPARWAQAPDMGEMRVPPRRANPALVVSLTPAEKVAQEEEAKLRARLSYEPRIEADKAAAVSSIETRAKQGAEATERTRSNTSAFQVYEQGMGGLYRGLAGANTNPVVGRLPAITADQQIAQGAEAAMAPVLKQMFRSAGEGTFTDKDQELLLRMLPTRADLPAARYEKLRNVDNIVRAKLGAPPPQRARNPKTGEVLELRFGQWVPAK